MGSELFTQPASGRLERRWRRMRFLSRNPGPWEQRILEEQARRRSQRDTSAGKNRMNRSRALAGDRSTPAGRGGQ